MLSHLQNLLFRSDADLWPTLAVWQSVEIPAQTAPAGGEGSLTPADVRSKIQAAKQEATYYALNHADEWSRTLDDEERQLAKIEEQYRADSTSTKNASASALAEIKKRVEEYIPKIQQNQAPSTKPDTPPESYVSEAKRLQAYAKGIVEKGREIEDDLRQQGSIEKADAIKAAVDKVAAYQKFNDGVAKEALEGFAKTINAARDELDKIGISSLSAGLPQPFALKEATKPPTKPTEVTPEQWLTFADQLKAYIAELKAANLDHTANKAAIEAFEKRLQDIVKIKPPANEADLRRLHADVSVFAETAKQDMANLPKLPEAGKPVDTKEKVANPNKRYVQVNSSLNVRDEKGAVFVKLHRNDEITIDPTQTKKGLHPTDKSIEYVRVTLGVAGASAKELYVAKSFLSDTPVEAVKGDGKKVSKPAKKPGAKPSASKGKVEATPEAEQLKGVGYDALKYLTENMLGGGTFKVDKGPGDQELHVTIESSGKNVRVTMPQDGKWMDIREIDAAGDTVGNGWLQIAENAPQYLYLVPTWMAYRLKGESGVMEGGPVSDHLKHALHAQWSMGQKLGIGMDKFAYDASDTSKLVLKADYKGKALELTVKDGKMDVTYNGTSTGTGYALDDTGFERAAKDLDAKTAPTAQMDAPPATNPVEAAIEQIKKHKQDSKYLATWDENDHVFVAFERGQNKYLIRINKDGSIPNNWEEITPGPIGDLLLNVRVYGQPNDSQVAQVKADLDSTQPRLSSRGTLRWYTNGLLFDVQDGPTVDLGWDNFRTKLNAALDINDAAKKKDRAGLERFLGANHPDIPKIMSATNAPTYIDMFYGSGKKESIAVRFNDLGNLTRRSAQGQTQDQSSTSPTPSPTPTPAATATPTPAPSPSLSPSATPTAAPSSGPGFTIDQETRNQIGDLARILDTDGLRAFQGSVALNEDNNKLILIRGSNRYYVQLSKEKTWRGAAKFTAWKKGDTASQVLTVEGISDWIKTLQ